MYGSHFLVSFWHQWKTAGQIVVCLWGFGTHLPTVHYNLENARTAAKHIDCIDKKIKASQMHLLPVSYFVVLPAWKFSKLWPLILTPDKVPCQKEVLLHRGTPLYVWAKCPPWSHSCSKPSSGISAYSPHCPSPHSPSLVIIFSGYKSLHVRVLLTVFLNARYRPGSREVLKNLKSTEFLNMEINM